MSYSKNYEKKDLVIVGAGPAGITAAIYAARKKMDFIVLAKNIGGQAAWSGQIENYPGFQMVSGPELAEKYRDHLEKFYFELREGEEAKKVKKSTDGFGIETSDGKNYTAKTVIIATGKRPKNLNAAGISNFINKGVTYCATCDGPVFTGRDVAIIGGGNSALDAALQMIKLASKVYIVNIGSDLDGDEVMMDKVRKAPNVQIMNNSGVKEVFGDQFLKGMKVDTPDGIKEIPIAGMFIEIGLVPNSDLIDFVEKNHRGEIQINCAAETSEPGVFAAGDVTTAPAKQIIAAAGDGAKATLSAFSYLSKH